MTTATAVLVAASFIGAGAVAVRSAPRNRVGYLLGAVGLLWALAKFLPPGSPRALLAGAWLAVLAHLVLAHPSGRLAGPPAVAGAARHLAGAARVVMGLGYLHAAAFGVLGAVAVSGAGVRAATMVGVMAVGAAVVAVQVVRWRAASAARRRTMNPFFAAGVLSTAAVLVLKPAIVAGVVLPRATPLLQVVLALVPLAYLASLVRSRLDRGGVAALVRRLSRLDPREVDGALAKVLHDPTVRVGYWAPHERTYLDIDGSPVIVEGDRVAARVDRDGAPLALLVHDRAAGEDQELLGATCAALALALRNDRRRLERDLHDGLQQRLLSVPVTLGLAESALRGRPEHAVALIGEAKTTALDALTELRGLVQGIHPPVLTERGLAGAVHELALLAPVPVHVSVGVTGPLPVGPETTAYYVVAEALANVAKHADARRAHVRLGRRAGWLTVMVEDDGRGGADPHGGTGLRGLADRVAADGGVLHVDSPAGHGTRVSAELPCG